MKQSSCAAIGEVAKPTGLEDAFGCTLVAAAPKLGEVLLEAGIRNRVINGAPNEASDVQVGECVSGPGAPVSIDKKKAGA